MAEVDCIARSSAATDEEVSQVANRIEHLLQSLVAMHDLCVEKIRNPTNDETWSFVLLRELLRSAARDAENCTETLRGTPGDIGYFPGHFGRI
ncbi:hypothetical protein [Burkholderia seminalis]|uniref:hypothetical protein n=1 Tax=Burkholderia seminalis TaxID=488731 RepID=UPI00145425E4|nr:hypothetical protein [Burkholderia seminalis]MCA8435344.1 hypothetical protein [Burkholderia seminalis]VWC35707.1 hypothetical protein BSE24067_06671 [Burkholderia seminalis]